MGQRYLNGTIAYRYFYAMGVELSSAERDMIDTAVSLGQIMSALTKLALDHPQITELRDMLDTVNEAHELSTDAHRTILKIREVMNAHTAGNVPEALSRMGIHDEPRKPREKKQVKPDMRETQAVRKAKH